MMCCLGIVICEVYVAAILHFLIYISVFEVSMLVIYTQAHG